MAKRQCAIASHLKVAYGSWTWTEENPWPPWSAVSKALLWKEPKYEGLRGLLQKPVAEPICEKSDACLVSIQCARQVLVEPSTGKLIVESDRVERMGMRCGVPVPSIISSLPFAACVIEVPRPYTVCTTWWRSSSCPVCPCSLRVSLLMRKPLLLLCSLRVSLLM